MIDNSAKTQIARTKASTPTSILNSFGVWNGKSVLHFGEGKAFADSDLMRKNARFVVAYDPHSPNVDRRDPIYLYCDYDVVVSNYVLNVLPPAERGKALLQIIGSLASGGSAYVSLRTDKVDGTPFEDGVITSKGTFQSTKSANEWAAELSGEIFHRGYGYVILKFVRP